MRENLANGRRVRTAAEAFGLGFFYFGMLAFFLYAVLGAGRLPGV